MKTVTCTFNPLTHKVVPIEPEQKILTAMAVSKAIDDEGEFLALMDLIDFSGENKITTVLKCAYKEAIAKAPEYPADAGLLFTHSYGEESYGLVKINSEYTFDVYEIPLYGGIERYQKTFNTYVEAVNYSKSFT